MTAAERQQTGRLVPAVFRSRGEAEAAIQELRQLGLSDEKLGVAIPDPVMHGIGQDIVTQEEFKSAASGFLIGAPVGSIAGVALLAIAAGGLGPLGVGGILAGAGAGAIWGMFIGAFGRLIARVHGEEEVPHWSEIPLNKTDILVIARADDRYDQAHEVMVRHGGRCFCLLDRLQRSTP